MLYSTNPSHQSAVVFKHFENKAYSVFRSLGKEVRIGVLSVATLTFANVDCVSAQTPQKQQKTVEQTVELGEVEVTGSLAPLSANQVARIVTTISREEIAASAAQSVNDLLKSALGVDVRQRGGFGVQTDISINGGTYDQVTFLLNGININTPQTGHLSADFPVALEDIERIEVLEGAASRILGGSAFSGAINIVTRPDSQSHVQVRADGGSYGTASVGARGAFVNGHTRHQLSGDWVRSDGGTVNSAFQKGRAFYQGGVDLQSADLRWQAGFCTQDFGANTFYSGRYPNQHEATTRMFGSVEANTKGRLHFTPALYWNRTYDHFELVQGSPKNVNFHRSDVFGARIGTYFSWVAGRTSVGAELRNEGIFSNNLGRSMEPHRWVSVPGQSDSCYTKNDHRTNLSYSVEHNFLWRKVTLSVGVVGNMNTGYDSKFHWYPGVDLAYRPTSEWRLYANWNKSFRMPTFTDLYYKSATQQGNAGLHPEESQSLMVGAKYQIPALKAQVQGFYHRGINMIDWVLYTATDTKYQSANFQLDNLGVETRAEVFFRSLWGPRCFLDRLSVGYTYIHQNRKDDTPIYKSNYALEYLRHKVNVALSHRVFSHLSASWNFRWQDRNGGYILYEDGQSTGVLKNYAPYGVLDLKLQWTAPRYTLYVSGNNLTGHTYYDHGNVPQPGLWIMAGGSFRVNL